MNYQLTPAQLAVNDTVFRNYNANEASASWMGGNTLGTPNSPSVLSGYTNLNPAGGTGAYSVGGGGGYGGAPSYGGTSTGTGGTFNLNPAPTQGSGTTFGMVPGAIGAPPSVWQQEQEIPGMAGLTGQETGLISSQLSGQISPTTRRSLTDSAAARGVTLGQGGNTGLVNETLLATLGLTSEQLQQQGSQNYLSFLSQSGSQQQNPQLLVDIASRNAAMAAAPNPTLAAQEAIALGQGTGRTVAPNYSSPSFTPPSYNAGTTNNYYSSTSPADSGGDNSNAYWDASTTAGTYTDANNSYSPDSLQSMISQYGGY